MGEEARSGRLPVIDAREVLSRIEEGYPVIYDHVAIAGDLDAGKIDLPLVHFERPAGEEQTASVVVSLIQIRNCELLGNVNFDHLLFKQCLDMCGCVFFQEARFKGATFSAGAKFEDCQFHRYATFKDAHFAQCARFQGTEFSAIANFGSCVFSCPVHFGQCHFSELCTNFGESRILEDADFTEARFSGTANFRLSSFGKSASFWKAEFLAGGIFQGVTFSGYASFQSTEMAGGADFRGAVFHEELNFEFARLPGSAIFLGACMKGQANFFRAEINDANFTGAVFLAGILFSQASTDRALFSGCQFQGGLDLSGAKIHTLRLQDASVSGWINLHNTEFLRLEARWASMSRHLAYDGAAYLALVKNFRNLEWFEDADDCYYHYRRASQSARRFLVQSDGRRGINWSKLSDCLAWISCGYGVRPGHTVFLSGMIVVVFALLYWTGGGIVVEPLNGSAPSISSQGDLGFLDNLYFSAMVFTAKTQVKWYPAGIYRYVATVESVLGWLLLALFLVSLGRTMIR